MKNETNSASAGTKGLYEATVKYRALQRAGANPNLNGHILEIMGGDKTNLNPLNWVNGVSEKLTASTTAKTVDAVVMKGGKVIERIQYKDTAKSIAETIRKVQNGQYASATLKGTTETARKFNEMAAKMGIAKRMQDTGISSETTKALGRACGACKGVSLTKAAMVSARSGGIWGAAIGGTVSAIQNISAVCKGEKEAGEAAKDFARDTAGAGISGMVSGAVGTSVGAVLVAAGAGTVAVVTLPVVAAIGVGWGVGKLWQELVG